MKVQRSHDEYVSYLKSLYESGLLEFRPQNVENGILFMSIYCNQLNPNPIYMELSKYAYNERGEEACIETLTDILLEDDSVSLE